MEQVHFTMWRKHTMSIANNQYNGQIKIHSIWQDRNNDCGKHKIYNIKCVRIFTFKTKIAFLCTYIHCETNRYIHKLDIISIWNTTLFQICELKADFVNIEYVPKKKKQYHNLLSTCRVDKRKMKLKQIKQHRTAMKLYYTP